MVLSLVKGQKIDITKNNSEKLNLIHIGLDWRAPKNLDIDASAFMIGHDGKIVREEDFVFYGQPSSSDGSVLLEESISTIEKQHFMINLSKVSADIQKISLTLTIYEPEKHSHSFADVSEIQLRIVNSRSQVEVATFPINYTFTKESAIVLGTLYRYSGEWKFHAVGAGYFGGLADLCRDYGVEVTDQPEEESQNQVTPNQIPTSPNQRFQVVQEREESETGEEIPKQPAEYVQLKRATHVQFSDSRIETLSQQSTELINLFADHDDETSSTTHLLPTETTVTASLLIDDIDAGDQEAFFHSLTEIEESFLLYIINEQITLDDAKGFLKQKGKMLALFVNTINEKANIHLGDNLLEIRTEFVAVFEEFEPLVAKIKERV
jgi:stress response protein SCP2